MTAAPILNRIPADSVGHEQLAKLQAFSDALNTLAVRDPQTGRVLVNRPALARFLDGHFPPDVARGLLARFDQGFSDHLNAQPGRHQVDWRELSQHGAPIHPLSNAEMNGSGLPEHPGHGEVENWVHQRYGALLATASQLTREQLSGLVRQESALPAAAEGTFTAAGTIAGFEACLERHLGWWAMLAVVGILGALLIIFTATGPISLPLTIWLIGVFGGGTATIILNCALNNAS